MPVNERDISPAGRPPDPYTQNGNSTSKEYSFKKGISNYPTDDQVLVDVNFDGFDKNSIVLSQTNYRNIHEHLRQAKQCRNTNPITLVNQNENVSETILEKFVILLEPMSHPDFDDKKKFFSNEFIMSRSVYSSQFGKFKISQITKNLKQNILAIEIENISSIDSENLLKVTNVGGWTVKCRRPRIHDVSYGVIGPIGLETSDEEMDEELLRCGYINAEAKRIYKGKDKNKTMYVKIKLEMPELPEYITLASQRFPVKIYISKPWQCFKCQKFGHNATNCNGKVKCVACSGPHNVKECPIKTPQEMKCPNCSENHAGSYGGCKYIKQAKIVERIRATEKLSYSDALKKAKESLQKENKNNVAASTIPEQPIPNSEPKSNQSNIIRTNTMIPNKQTSKPQTRNSKEGEQQFTLNDEANRLKEEILKDILPKLILALIKIINTEKNENYINAIKRAVEESINIKLPDLEQDLVPNEGAAAEVPNEPKSSTDYIEDTDMDTGTEDELNKIFQPQYSRNKKRSPGKIKKRNASQSQLHIENPQPSKKMNNPPNEKPSNKEKHSTPSHSRNN